MNNKSFLPIAIIFAGLVIAGAIYLTSGGTTPGGDPLSVVEGIEVAPITENDHILGNPNAQLVIVEYSDYECPFCKNFHATMQRIMDEYGRAGSVAWVYRHYPIVQIHPKAETEAQAAECVAELGGNEAFWDFTNTLFGVTPSNNGLDLAILPDLAESAGVNRADFESCLDEGRTENIVRAHAESAIAAGAEGTPYSVIVARTGQLVPINGNQPYEKIKQAIDLLLGE